MNKDKEHEGIWTDTDEEMLNNSLEEKEQSTIPTREGYYWAKEAGYAWYNLIVDVCGEPPFLYIEAIYDIDRKEVTKDPKPYQITKWGTEIADPD